MRSLNNCQHFLQLGLQLLPLAGSLGEFQAAVAEGADGGPDDFRTFNFASVPFKCFKMSRRLDCNGDLMAV